MLACWFSLLSITANEHLWSSMRLDWNRVTRSKKDSSSSIAPSPLACCRQTKRQVSNVRYSRKSVVDNIERSKRDGTEMETTESHPIDPDQRGLTLTNGSSISRLTAAEWPASGLGQTASMSCSCRSRWP